MFCEDKDFKGKKRIGIMGGAFDPVHNGHIQTMEKAIKSYQLDMGVFLPTADKEIHSKKNKINSALRCRMLEMSLPANLPIYVSKYEVDYKGDVIPYTANTIEHFMHCCDEKDVKFYFIAGSDIIYHLSRWKAIDTLKDLCEFIFVPRTDDAFGQVKGELQKLNRIGVRYTLGEWRTIPISSTQVRSAIGNHKDISHLLPFLVQKFICENKLYQ
jgi:nicotinate-nucleotide adenylyltransferase